jgi:hypothetical protein
MWLILGSGVSIGEGGSDSLLALWCRRSTDVNLVLLEKAWKRGGLGGGIIKKDFHTFRE